MTNLIIASFHQEAEATAASQKLRELESIGDITIYEHIVVKKDATGKVDVLEADTIEGGLTTLSGMTVGALIGALAGPVGLTLGIFTGALAGAAQEVDDYGFADDFITKAEEQLQPGMIAVIAEIEESDPIFIDTSLTPLSATLTRTNVDYEYTKYSDAEVDELDEDIAAARAKFKAAAEEDKDKIRKKIARLKEKRKDLIEGFKEKVKETETDLKASAKERKIAKIRSKIEKHQTKIADLEKKLEAAVH